MPDRIFLGHTTAVVRQSVTRPANATVYAAGEVIGTAVTAELLLDAIARSAGGKGMIADVTVIDSANQATKPSLELWLFKSPVVAVADNAAWAPTDAELANLVGIITIATSFVGTATVGDGGNCILKPSVPPMLPFECGVNDDALYGYLIVRNAYTPVSGEVFTVIVSALQDY
jgi:hypothetical protein